MDDKKDYAHLSVGKEDDSFENYANIARKRPPYIEKYEEVKEGGRADIKKKKIDGQDGLKKEGIPETRFPQSTIPSVAIPVPLLGNSPFHISHRFNHGQAMTDNLSAGVNITQNGNPVIIRPICNNNPFQTKTVINNQMILLRQTSVQMEMLAQNLTRDLSFMQLISPKDPIREHTLAQLLAFLKKTAQVVSELTQISLLMDKRVMANLGPHLISS